MNKFVRSCTKCFKVSVLHLWLFFPFWLVLVLYMENLYWRICCIWRICIVVETYFRAHSPTKATIVLTVFYCILNFNPSRPNPGRRKKIKSNFYFHTSLWCLKIFYEGLKGLKGLHKTFWGTTKKCENKNLTYFYSNTTFRNARPDGKGKQFSNHRFRCGKIVLIVALVPDDLTQVKTQLDYRI